MCEQQYRPAVMSEAGIQQFQREIIDLTYNRSSACRPMSDRVLHYLSGITASGMVTVEDVSRHVQQGTEAELLGTTAVGGL